MIHSLYFIIFYEFAKIRKKRHFSPQIDIKVHFYSKNMKDSELVRILAATNLTTLPVDQRTRVRLFCLMSIEAERATMEVLFNLEQESHTTGSRI